MNEATICVVRKLGGYAFVPSCMIGQVSGLTPHRD